MEAKRGAVSIHWNHRGEREVGVLYLTLTSEKAYRFFIAEGIVQTLIESVEANDLKQ